MSVEENKALVRRLIEGVWNTGNYSELAGMASADFARSSEALNRAVRITFPDHHNEIQEMIAEGDKVVARWSFTGTQTGPFESPLGTIAPSGKQVTVTAVHIFRIADGKIVERSAVVDTLGMLQQMGALPTTAS